MNNQVHQRGEYTLIELPAIAAITPGMLIMEAATGIQPHATAGGVTEKMFALEDALQGRTMADQYVIGDPVQAAIERPGNLVQAMLLAGVHYTVGMQLQSHGDGTLTTVSTGAAIAVVTKDIDLSVGGSVNTASQVRVL